ncbi:MAG: response regulator [Pseudomonadota bacterium]
MPRTFPRRPRRILGSRHLLRDLFTTMHRPRVLVAEDDEELRALLVLTLSEADYDVVQAANGVELQCWLDAATRFGDRHHTFDLVITDLRMPGLSGLDVLEQLRLVDWATRVILISAFADEEVQRDASRLGAAAVLAKPFGLEEFLGAVRSLVPPLAA